MKKCIAFITIITMLVTMLSICFIPITGMAEDAVKITVDKTILQGGDTITAYYEVVKSGITLLKAEWQNYYADHSGAEGNIFDDLPQHGSYSFEPRRNGTCVFTVYCKDQNGNYFACEGPVSTVNGIDLIYKESLEFEGYGYYMQRGETYSVDYEITGGVGEIKMTTYYYVNNSLYFEVNKQITSKRSGKITYLPPANVYSFSLIIDIEDSNGGHYYRQLAWVTIEDGHKEVIDKGHPATEYSTGLTDGKHCSVCGKVLVAQETIPKLAPNSKVRAFVTRCYKIILGRNPDSGGLESWTQALVDGSAAASQIIDGFVNSPEFLNKHLSNGDAVEVLYNAMLGRGSDAAGKAAWAAALDAGNPFAVIINGFCGSTEFRNLCAEYGIQPGSVAVGNVIPSAPTQPVVTGDITKIKAFVTRCYQVILSRDPDGGGLDSWAQALATGQGQASQIIDGFVNSPEFLNKHLSNGDAVEVLYKAMLGRGSDPAGKQAWTAALDAGQPFAVIINGFCGSPEFTNLCASYGITPGSVTVKGVKHRNEGIAPEDANAVSAPVAKGGYNSEYINEEKVREFVIHCYWSVLGRDGDEQGIANYMAAIMDGIKSPRQVAHEFVFSPEFRANLPGNEDFIRILYRLYLNREADGDGLANWVAQLEAGAGLEEIVNGFASSQEFRNIVDRMKK